MEIKVSNLSKLAPKDVLKTLFGTLGTIIYFEHQIDVIKKDGSYECKIIYSNLSEAKRALCLSGTQLGDRQFNVFLPSNYFPSPGSSTAEPAADIKVSSVKRQDGLAFIPTLTVPLGSNIELTKFADYELRKCVQIDSAKTALVSGLPRSFTPEQIVVLCGGTDLVLDAIIIEDQFTRRTGFVNPPANITADKAPSTSQSSGEVSHMALVEFIDRSSMLLAKERIKVALLPDGSSCRMEETWKRIGFIDEEYNRVQRRTSQGSSRHSSRGGVHRSRSRSPSRSHRRSKSPSRHSRSHHHHSRSYHKYGSRRYSRSPSRSRSRDRRRSRSPDPSRSGSRERRHHHRR